MSSTVRGPFDDVLCHRNEAVWGASQALLLAKAADIERAVSALQDAKAKQQRLKAMRPEVYDEPFHAAGIAQHLQGICAQLESLLKLVIENTDGTLPMGETWHQDLVRRASMPTARRVALIDAAGAKGLASAFGFRHAAESNHVAELDPLGSSSTSSPLPPLLPRWSLAFGS